MEERPALVRIAVLCGLLAQELDDFETEIPTAQLIQELIALRERAESELSRSS